LRRTYTEMMRRRPFRIKLAATLLLVVPSAAAAQTTVVLPDTSQTTTVSVNVSEQARVIVPTGITFNVTNIGASTPASPASVTVDRIVLATATKQLKLSLQANAASFTPPVTGATTWAAGDVTWNAPGWTNATGSTGTLSGASYSAVATCAADATSCSTTGLVFTLGPNTAVQRSGTHTLVVTWKFESMGS
jgi:hypothetical protein